MAGSGLRLNLDPVGKAENTIFPEKGRGKQSFHEKIQGEFVLCSQKSEELLSKSP